MKRIMLWGIIAFTGFCLAACGGSSSSSSDPVTPDPVGTPTTGFTAEMLNDTYYVTYLGDPDGTTNKGTTQETIVMNGTGLNATTVTINYFDASKVLVGTETFAVNITLNQDGTLTATETGDTGETTLTLTEETAGYLYVKGVEGTDTWDDYWNFAKPAGWLTADSGTPPTGFTAEMLNDTYYVTYSGNPDIPTDLGTTQETIVMNGVGTNAGTFTEEYFDANDDLVSTETGSFNIALNEDGTLTFSVTGDPSATTMTLIEETASYLLVNGDEGTDDTWEDYWNFAKPAGWIYSDISFTASDITGQNFVEIVGTDNTIISFGEGTTTGSMTYLNYENGVTATGTGTWTLDNGVVNFEFGAGDTGSFELTSRDTNSISLDITDIEGTSNSTWAKTEPFVVTDVANKTFAPNDVAGETIVFGGAGAGYLSNPEDGIINFTYAITNGVLTLTFTDGWSSELYKIVGSTASNVVMAVADYNQAVLDEVSRFTMILQ